MKKIVLSLAVAGVLLGCKSGASSASADVVNATIDLINVKDDKVQVTIVPSKFTAETATFMLPKTVPGTYSEDDYGKYIEDVKAFDSKGNTLPLAKLDENTYRISNASKLAKVTYWVNDTYDSEQGGGFGNSEDVFSPAGTNIKVNENFMLNMHGFVGYFAEKTQTPYKLTVLHPAHLLGVSALTDADPSDTSDVFFAARYAHLVDNPMMYSKPDFTSFMVDDMEIIISVYSPSGKYTAKDITSNMETMMRAQKAFLGKMNTTKKYAILLYLSQGENDAQGYGALEHPTSTTVVFPEMMGLEMLKEQMKDVVSHEFFHIVTPLTIHSDEIHYFDFNNPKMSEHLWMYEGVTEYFANLFQVNQGLISESEFYKRMTEKIDYSRQLNDKMSFTKMSKNVLEQPYKDQYINVYQKGALIAMCIDIIIRENSDGERGILDLMNKLSAKYGSSKSFQDKDLFAEITELTYPAVGEFLQKYVAGETPIPYDVFFEKMGVAKTEVTKTGNPFLKGQIPYITINPSTKEIMYIPNIEPNEFMSALGLLGGDSILEVNGTAYNQDNVYDMVMNSMNWKEGDDITVKIKRNNAEKTVKGKVVLPKEKKEGYASGSIKGKDELRAMWLKG